MSNIFNIATPQSEMSLFLGRAAAIGGGMGRRARRASSKSQSFDDSCALSSGLLSRIRKEGLLSGSGMLETAHADAEQPDAAPAQLDSLAVQPSRGVQNDLRQIGRFSKGERTGLGREVAGTNLEVDGATGHSIATQLAGDPLGARQQRAIDLVRVGQVGPVGPLLGNRLRLVV